MAKVHSRILKAFGVLSALALGLALTAPTMAAAAPPVYGLQSAGQIADVLSSTQFVLALQGGDDLAVNMTPSTRIVDDLTSGSGVATGEYAVVNYHFGAHIGAVASRVILSNTPSTSGKVRHLIGMVTAVSSGAFTLENANGVRFTVDLLPTTRLRWVQTGIEGSAMEPALPPIAVGDFADAAARSAGPVYDAVEVTYSNAPVGIKTHNTIKGAVSGVSGDTLSLTLGNSGALSVTVLPSALITLNGRLSALSQLAPGDHVRLQAVPFVGMYYATVVVAATP
jgi:hypothetical protein